MSPSDRTAIRPEYTHFFFPFVFQESTKRIANKKPVEIETCSAVSEDKEAQEGSEMRTSASEDDVDQALHSKLCIRSLTLGAGVSNLKAPLPVHWEEEFDEQEQEETELETSQSFFFPFTIPEFGGGHEVFPDDEFDVDSTTTAARTVRFAPQEATVLEFEPVCEAQHFNIWFSRNDYYFMRTRDKLIVELIEAGIFQETEEHTLRGLEDHLREDFETLLVDQALRAVLDEQTRQMELGVLDPELIAEAYANVSTACLKFARLLGQRDELEVIMTQESRRGAFQRRSNSIKSQSYTKTFRQPSGRRRSNEGITAEQTTKTTSKSGRFFRRWGSNKKLVVTKKENTKQQLQEDSVKLTKRKSRRGLFRAWSSKRVVKEIDFTPEQEQSASEAPEDVSPLCINELARMRMQTGTCRSLRIESSIGGDDPLELREMPTSTLSPRTQLARMSSCKSFTLDLPFDEASGGLAEPFSQLTRDMPCGFEATAAPAPTPTNKRGLFRSLSSKLARSKKAQF